MEEETFDYRKLRYILGHDGYICHASIGGLIVCDLGECTEYTGEIPNNYFTIEEWYDSEYERLNAWKIVDGNLVFDTARYSQLQKKCAKEEEENRLVHYKEIKNITSIYKQDLYEMYQQSTSEESNLVEVTDANRFEVIDLKLKSNGDIATTEEAKEHYIKGSSDAYCKSVEIYGESTQETRSGKNKLPFKYHDSTGKTVYGITFTVNDDGSVTANGPASGNASFNLTSNGFDLPAGKYKLVGENKNYTGPAIRGSYYKADGTVKYVSSSHGEFVIDEDDYNFNFYIVILNGTTVNNLTFYPMLLLTDETDLTFERGGASPSSEHPSEIKSLNENLNIKSVGENLLKNVEKKSVTSYGITFSYNEDGTYTANGTNNGKGNSAAYLNYNLFLKAGTYYTIPTNVNGYTMTGFDGTKYIGLATNNVSSFTLAKDTTFKNIYIQVVNGITTPVNNFVFYPMISTKPINVEDYKPYQESITTIPLLHDMRSLPNGTRDRIYWQDGKWYDEQNIIEKTITRNESGWYANTGRDGITTKFYQFNITDQSNAYGTAIIPAMSNYFKCNVNAWQIEDTEKLSIQSNNGVVMIRINSETAPTLDDLKNWLDEHELKVIYELDKPIITEITDPAIIEALESVKTFKGTTIIAVDAPSVLTYVTPIKNKITVKSTNANMLPNEATSKEESGISFVEMEDKSIILNGTATADIEYVIAGTNTNTKPILQFKKNIDYFLSSGGYTVTMYNYDGTDRTQVYSGTEAIKFTDEDKSIMQVVISIPNGTVIDNETIYLMLNKGTEAEPYVMHDSNEVTIDLGEYEFDIGNSVDLKDGEATLYEELYPSDTLYPSSSLYPKGIAYDLGDIGIMPTTYKGKTYIYAYENVELYATYPNNVQNIKYENTSSANGGFSVDEEGNASIANGAVKINSAGIQMADGTEIVGATGVFSIFEYDGKVSYANPLKNGQYEGLGIRYNPLEIKYEPDRMVFDVYIPENFSIKKAYIMFRHYPIDVYYIDASKGQGYCRDLKLFDANDTELKTTAYVAGEYRNEFDFDSLVEIENAFGEASYTPSSTELSHIQTNDISENLSTGFNRLAIMSTTTMPTVVENDFSADIEAMLKTGMVQATLVVMGFSK